MAGRPRAKGVVDRREGREAQIVDTAAQLFRQQGYASTSVRDIAAAIGVNVATPHYYFGSKPAILYRIYQDTFDAFDDVEIEELPAHEALLALAKAGALVTAQRSDYVAVFFQEFRWLDRHLPEEMCRDLRDRESRFMRRMLELAKHAIGEGTIRAVDPRAVVSNIIGVSAWTYQWHRSGEPGALEGVALDCVELLFNGLLITPR
ncbi:MAG TPA: TetR/AcrR family transcriptional regulator [Pseudonocardia sp.]|nr:TetR/AcrR family transcriptional regulator [Pseudonocardia sp.]